MLKHMLDIYRYEFDDLAIINRKKFINSTKTKILVKNDKITIYSYKNNYWIIINNKFNNLNVKKLLHYYIYKYHIVEKHSFLSHELLNFFIIFNIKEYNEKTIKNLITNIYEYKIFNKSCRHCFFPIIEFDRYIFVGEDYFQKYSKRWNNKYLLCCQEIVYRTILRDGIKFKKVLIYNSLFEKYKKGVIYSKYEYEELVEHANLILFFIILYIIFFIIFVISNLYLYIKIIILLIVLILFLICSLLFVFDCLKRFILYKDIIFFVEHDYDMFVSWLKGYMLNNDYIKMNNNNYKKDIFISFGKTDFMLDDNHKGVIFYKDNKQKLLNKDNVMEIQFVNEEKILIVVNKSHNIGVFLEFTKIMKYYYDDVL